MRKRKGCLSKVCKCTLSTRLNKIIGQIQGIERMINEERYCVDILQQISSVHEALRGLGKEIMRNYLEQCATRAILSKKKEHQQMIYKEIMDIIYKYAR